MISSVRHRHLAQSPCEARGQCIPEHELLLCMPEGFAPDDPGDEPHGACCSKWWATGLGIRAPEALCACPGGPAASGAPALLLVPTSREQHGAFRGFEWRCWVELQIDPLYLGWVLRR